MGRRDVRLEDQDRWVFNRLAALYAARPAYPAALVERLAALAGGPGARVADLGAGTGHLALPLAARGLRVAAVEPARAMLAALEAGRAGLPPAPAAAIEPVAAAAEDTGLPAGAFGLVLFADAVQWVDPERAGAEAARLLAPEGAAAVVEAAFAPTPFMTGLRRLLERANARARPRPHGATRQLLALAAPGAAPTAEAFRQEASLDDAALADLLGGLSYAGPALGAEGLAALVEDARALARSAGGALFCRDLTLRWARRRPR